jgi:hypothetical protein
MPMNKTYSGDTSREQFNWIKSDIAFKQALTLSRITGKDV